MMTATFTVQDKKPARHLGSKEYGDIGSEWGDLDFSDLEKDIIRDTGMNQDTPKGWMDNGKGNLSDHHYGDFNDIGQGDGPSLEENKWDDIFNSDPIGDYLRSKKDQAEPVSNQDIVGTERSGIPGQLLTGPEGAQFEITETQQRTIAVFKTDDHEAVAWIDQNNPYSPEGLSIISLVEGSGYKVVRTLPVDIARIASAYATGASAGGFEAAASEQQEIAMAIFADAARQGASDIHIISDKGDQCRVLYRINGDLIPQPRMTRSYEEGIQLVRTIYNAMSQEGSNNFRVEDKLDGRISKRQFLPENIESIRVSAIGTNNAGHSCVMRLLYNSSVHDVDFASLGYHQRHIKGLNYITRRPYGCCIISGPTGSGKSTTLKGLLQKIIVDFDYKKNVMTVEDPCEYPIEGARQTSVFNANTEEERKTAYSRSITAAMRHDPDVIMIGEIRDLASATLAFAAAKTGHLLPASLHANNAMSIPGRLLDIGIKPEDVYDPTLMIAMISQRLVKLLCPHCKLPLKDYYQGHSAAEVLRVERVLGNLDGVYVCGNGCEHCRDGVIDRTVVSEIILPDEGLMALLREHKRPEAMLYWQEKLDGLTMNDHAILKILDGIVDPFHAEIQLGELQPAFRRRGQ